MRARTRRTAVLCAAFAVLTGCSGADDGESADRGASPSGASTSSVSSTTTTSSTSPTSSTSEGGERPGRVAPALAALTTAASSVTDGQSYDLEGATYRGEPVFEAKVASGADAFEVVVSADGSRVLRRDRRSRSDDDVRKLQRAEVEAFDALRTAAAAHPDGDFDEMEIDTRDARVVWEVELRRGDGTGIEVTVDAVSGAILRTVTDHT